MCLKDFTHVARVCHPCDTCISSTGHMVARKLVTCTLCYKLKVQSAQWFSFRMFYREDLHLYEDVFFSSSVHREQNITTYNS